MARETLLRSLLILPIVIDAVGLALGEFRIITRAANEAFFLAALWLGTPYAIYALGTLIFLIGRSVDEHVQTLRRGPWRFASIAAPLFLVVMLVDSGPMMAIPFCIIYSIFILILGYIYLWVGSAIYQLAERLGVLKSAA